MSALGQKQTFAVQTGMSALPPIATSNATQGNVCFGPKADIASYSTTSSACNNIEGGTARLSAPAVLTFIAISNLTGTWTGNPPMQTFAAHSPCLLWAKKILKSRA